MCGIPMDGWGLCITINLAGKVPLICDKLYSQTYTRYEE